jgi:hypothetical protein
MIVGLDRGHGPCPGAEGDGGEPDRVFRHERRRERCRHANQGPML